MKKESNVNMAPSERVSLPEKVAHAYYSHGLICSSHPIIVLCFAMSVIVLFSYPLINLPLPGVVPIQTVTQAINSEKPDNVTVFSGKPYVYVQQIVLKVGVSPWLSSMTVHDAFRSPLHQVFPLLETIRNFHVKNRSDTVSISNLCLHVESVKLKSSEDRRKLLPEYNCLILSPANLWQQNEMNFQMDNHLIGTIFNYHNIQKGKISLTEILFGINVKESGLKRHPMRSRPRTLKYAVTLVLEHFDESYISGLRKKLESHYPLHVTSHDFGSNKSTRAPQETLHIYYPGEFSFRELFPLVTVYTVLFLYIYFSLRKVEPVKSKIGIAFSAVVTTLSCLCMSLGMCFFFGLTVSLNGKEIFPYLVGIVGLENVLVITESITNTPSHLDVKIRVAQGLSREGWSITKNLLIQVTILTIGFATFVTAIQELCILGIVGLVCDFFLQLCFFTTILSIDIHRKESNFDNKSSYYYHSTPVQRILSNNKIGANPYLRYYGKENKNLMRSKSHHNLTSCFKSSSSQSVASYPANVLAISSPILNKIPKRLRLVHIWASTRFFQRIFMIAMIGWMCFKLYNGSYFHQLFQMDEIAKFHEKLEEINEPRSVSAAPADEIDLKTVSAIPGDESSGHIKQELDHLEGEETSEDMNRFRHREQDPHRRLSLYHWPVLMSLYNISLTGKYITILPAIRISHVVSPEKALLMHNPNEKMEHFQWKTLAVALDPIDFSSSDVGSKMSSLLIGSIDRPFVPRSPMEIALACILIIVSIFVLSYTTMVFYRCICTRNYAEWRSSWESNSLQESDTQVILEAVPTSLEGHVQEIECVATDGYTIVSTCLDGQIRVWNAAEGELINHINRQAYFSSLKTSESFNFDSDLNHSDYESGSPPSRGECEISHFMVKSRRTKNLSEVNSSQFTVPVSEDRGLSRKSYKGDIQLKPNINFSELKLVNFSNSQRDSKKGFDFCSQYKFLLNDKRASVGDIEAYDERKSTYPSSFSCNLSAENVNDFESSRKRCSLPANCENFNDLTNSGYVNELLINSETNDNRTGIPPVWCLDCLDTLIVLGCSDGRIEFWESLSSKLKCIYEDGSNIGVTAVKFIEDRVVAARLNGSLDFFQLDTQPRIRHNEWGFTSARRTHVRTGSAGSALDWEKGSDEIRCRKLGTVRAHQQPITVLECENGRVVTGSQDHTLKVLRVEDHSLLYTLHGHCGPITCMFIDKMTPFLSGSGSQDGLLCVWDLLTGACIYSIQAHDGSVTALAYSASYVISLGMDERLCVWERFLGHLLNTIHVMHAYCTSMVMLTHNLLITSKQGSLVMWDVRCGDPVRIVRLGDSDHSVFVKQMLNLGDSVVCDYGNQLRIVKFPIITDKTE